MDNRFVDNDLVIDPLSQLGLRNSKGEILFVGDVVMFKSDLDDGEMIYTIVKFGHYENDYFEWYGYGFYFEQAEMINNHLEKLGEENESASYMTGCFDNFIKITDNKIINEMHQLFQNKEVGQNNGNK